MSYAWRDLTLGATWRYIDSMTDADPSLDPDVRGSEVNYFDLSANYEFSSGFLDGLRIGLGIEN